MRCHAGPDSPDKEVFEASKHGMLYVANRDRMNLNGDTWIAGKDYSAAPTCVTCHMGAAGKLPANHDVGMRDAWRLNTPVSERQYLVMFVDGDKRDLPASQEPPKRGEQFLKNDGTQAEVKFVIPPDRRRQAMQSVCLECHSKAVAEGFMKQFDNVVELFNTKFAIPARGIMADLYAAGKLTPLPFDEPIELTYWELWHDEGARARHGAAMASPNHAWWEGMYLVGRNFYSRFLPQVREVAGPDAQTLIDRHVSYQDQHQWLRQPQQTNPILGFGKQEAGGG